LGSASAGLCRRSERAVSELDLLARIACAAALGAVIGFEREARGHPAGVKTHSLVAVGAALFTIAGAYGFADIPRSANVDPARIAAQVATGIGFVGAGAIIKFGGSVRGLTTAATLWLAGAVGVGVGAGAWIEASAGVAVVFGVLLGFRWIAPAVLSRISPSQRVLEVEYERGHGTLGPVMRQLELVHGRLGRIRLEDDPEGAAGRRLALVEITTDDRDRLDELVTALRLREEVLVARWRDGRIEWTESELESLDGERRGA
jgi:putative Mg2+ transporter-C (MgtC) family protein